MYEASTCAPQEALRRDLAKLRRRQRCVSRRPKGSANRTKAIKQLAQAHRCVANVRQNALHQATSRLARKCKLYRPRPSNTKLRSYPADQVLET